MRPHAFKLLRIARSQHQTRPLARQLPRKLRTDAVAGPGDHDHLVREIHASRVYACPAMTGKDRNSNGTSGIVSSPSAVVNGVDFVLSAPEKWQESPSEECLGSHEQPEKVGLRARSPSAPADLDRILVAPCLYHAKR